MAGDKTCISPEPRDWQGKKNAARKGPVAMEPSVMSERPGARGRGYAKRDANALGSAGRFPLGQRQST